MEKQTSRKERLLALVLAFAMIFTSMSSSFAMALSGTVTESIRAEIQAGSTNYSFKLKTTENSKTKMYDGTCMEPSNDTIPQPGMTATMSELGASSMLAKIAYLGIRRHTSNTEKQMYVISRAAGRYNNAVPEGYIYADDVDDLYNDAKAMSGSVPASFAVYKAAPSNGGQNILAWRNRDNGSIKVKKTSSKPSAGVPLTGAKYGVYPTKADASANTERIGTLNVKAGGESGTLSLKPGQYYVKEYEAPEGYLIDKTIYPVTVKEDQTATVESTDTVAEGKIQIKKVTTISPIPDGYSLAGAQYGVYKTKADANSDTNRIVTMNIKDTGLSGTYTLLAGTYYVKEVKCPSWLKLDTAVHTAEITHGKTTVVESTDIPKDGTLTLIKESTKPELGLSLAGAEYGVYETKADAKANKNKKYTLTTKADGTTNKLTLAPGWYYVKEYKAPDGFALDTNLKIEYLEPGEDAVLHSKDRPVIDTSLRVQKHSSMPELGYPSLAGAEYRVYDDKEAAKVHDDDHLVGTLITDETGLTNKLEGLDPGWYYIKEYEPPYGYYTDNTILIENLEMNEHVTKNSTDEPKPGQLQLKKVSADPSAPYSLAGAEYRIYTDLEGARNHDETYWTGKTLVTDETGMTNIVTLDPGWYYVNEYKAPYGYERQSFIWKENMKVGEDRTLENALKSTETPIPGKLQLQKVPDTETTLSLAGAEYGVYKSTDDAQADENRIGTLITGEDGYSNIIDLYEGTYYVKETLWPYGFDQDMQIHTAVVKADSTSPCVVKSTEPVSRGKLTLIKEALHPTDKSIAGAEYGVYPSQADAQADTNKLHTFVTKADGTTETITLPPKTYYVKETHAPAGWEPDPEIHVAEVIAHATCTVYSTELETPKVWLQKTTKATAPASKTDYSKAGAKYGIYASESDALNNVNSKGTLVTDENGDTNVLELPPGTYYVREFYAPANLEPDQTTHKVVLTPGETEVVKSTDPISTGSVKVKKVAASESFVLTECPEQYSLAGAEYTIYAKSSLAASSKVGTLVTDANGNTPELELTVGDYWIIETKASPGFKLDGQGVTEITIERNEVKTHTSKETPMTDPINIVVDKESGNDKENRPSLAGGQFSVKYYPEITDNVSGLTPARTWIFETKEFGGKGRILLDDAYKVGGDALFKDKNGEPTGLIGTYVITEEKAPAGYMKDPVSRYAYVNTDGTVTNPEVSYTNQPTVPNDPKEFRLKLIKEDSETGNTAQGDADLAGAVFGLYRDGKLLKEFTVGTDYTYTTEYYNIGDGSQVYTVKEITPPE